MNGRKSKLLPFIPVVLLIVLAGIIAADYFIGSSEYAKSDIAMGTVISQKLTGKNAEKAAQQIIDRISEVENNNLSMNVSASDIAKINSASGSSVEISSDTVTWLNKTLEVCESSSYALDISLGALSSLWGIGSDNARVPKQSEIDKALETVGADRIVISGDTVKIPFGQKLDMGALGKGIACDEAKKIAEEQGLKRAVVSAGGSILLYGGGKFKVGIRNPSGDANDYMGVLNITASFVSTSGNYEKVLTVDGKTYHHILNPSTGYPAESGLTSVTVVCESGLMSDALSTACFVLGYDASLPLLEKYGAEAVFIFEDNSVAVTDGLSESFTVQSADYKLR